MVESILHRVADGEPSAVKELTTKYGGLVYSLARRFCFQPAEIEDAVQDIFVALWKAADRYDASLGSEETFVSMVARRRLIDRGRRAQRRLAPTGMDPDVLTNLSKAAATPDQTERDELGSRALECLGKLRPEQQLAVRLAILRGLSHEQIATVTGMPLGTVKTHVRRGLMALRESISPAPAITTIEEGKPPRFEAGAAGDRR